MRRISLRNLGVRTIAWGLSAGLVATLFAVTGGSTATALANGPVPPQQRTENHVSAEGLPTVQINSGIVWTQAIAGNTVFAGGAFTGARPAGAQANQNVVDRVNILAYDIRTGELLPFNPRVNGVVKALAVSPDGKRLYMGGSFTSVNGKPRYTIAAFDIATGELISSFQPPIGGSFVNAISVTDSTVYVGGLFTQARGVSRTNLAAFDLNGNLTGWAPRTNLQVDAMVVAPGDQKVIIGGRFDYINNSRTKCSASVDAVTGVTQQWNLNSTNMSACGGGGSGVMGLSTDGKNIYGAGWLQMSWYFEGIWAANPADGSLIWAADGQGDMYDVYAGKAGVIAVGHSHVATPFGGWQDMKTPGGRYQYAMSLTPEAQGTLASGGRSSMTGNPAPGLVQWYPNFLTGSVTDAFQAGWTVEGNDDYVIIGGEFIGLNGKIQQGLVRFARPGVQKVSQRPRLSAVRNGEGQTWENPTYGLITGGATFNIPPNFDRDDRALTYQLIRSGTATPVASTVFNSDPWLRSSQRVQLSDTSAQPNTTYTYTIRAVDGEGNSAISPAVSVKTSNFVVPMQVAAKVSMTDLTGAFSADGSRAAAGRQIASYQWKFGDGQSASGATVTHAYAKAGTYTAELTVTDDLGQKGVKTLTVTATNPAPGGVIAQDAFERTATTWGTSDKGGAWATNGRMQTTNGAGIALSKPGITDSAWLNDSAARDSDTMITFSLDKESAGGGTFVSASARRNGTSDYRTKLVFNADQTVSVSLTRIVDGQETVVASKQASGKAAANVNYQVRFQAVTTDTGTALRANFWVAGTPEPTTWLLEGTDTTPALQGAGSPGIVTYLSAKSTLTEQTVRIHDLKVTTP